MEAYDHHEDDWTDLQDIVRERDEHSALSIGNKLFVATGSTWSNRQMSCEVFDSASRQFTEVNIPTNFLEFFKPNYMVRAIAVGGKISFFL